MPVYVQHQVLGKIDDVFNAEAIWQAPGLALFSRRPLLRDLLERSPREHRGRAPTRCFSHVTLMLPQEDVDDDRHLTRGNRARDLAETLKALHQKDFGDLLGNDEVRYGVVGDERLQPGEIEVRFGHAVYLPAAGEPVLYNVTVSRDSVAWKPVCQIWLDQRLAVLGAESDLVSHVVPGWPFGDECQVLIINDGPDKPAEVQARPRNALDCHYDPLNGCHVIRARGTAHGERVFLKLTRTMAGMKARRPVVDAPSGGGIADMPAAVWKSRTPDGAPQGMGDADAASAAIAVKPAAAIHDAAGRLPAANGAHDHALAATDDSANVSRTEWFRAGTGVGTGVGSAGGAMSSGDAAAGGVGAEATAVPISQRAAATAKLADAEPTYAPVARQAATLVAIALPRLSRYRDSGAATMSFGFDGTLAVAPQPDHTLLRISVDSDDRVLAATADGETVVSAPATFSPVDGRAITVAAVARQMADRYLALITLPEPRRAAIGRGARLSFGRAAPALATLRVLDATADRLGLSRNAFTFEVGDGVYRIARQSATQALYHLDDQLRFVAAIAEATPEQPYLLPSGHHLVAGHYVLRFDA